MIISSRLPAASVPFFLFHVLAILPLCAQEPSAAAPSAIAGAAVFREQGCVACHSVNGSGGTVGPDLQTLSSSTDVYGMTAALWNHLPEMAAHMDSLSIPRPRLSAREAGDLVAYVYMLGGAERAGSAEAGAELFRESGCIRCHRAGTAGGVIGPALDRIPSLQSPHGLAAGLWNHSGAMIPRMNEMGIPYPTLTAEDLSNLGSFLRASSRERHPVTDAPAWVLPGDPVRGRTLVEQEGCTSCHRISGRGAGSAPELAAPGIRRSNEAYLAALWNKGPAMRAAFAARGDAPPSFEPGEMADLTSYLQSLGYFQTSGDAGRGSRIARTGGCLDCHGWNADGPAAGDLARIAPRPDVADRLAVLWNHLTVLDASDPSQGDWSRVDRSEMADLLEFLGTASQ
jgi:cytochrome c551/c552